MRKNDAMHSSSAGADNLVEKKPVSFGWVFAMVLIGGTFLAVSYNLWTKPPATPTGTVMERPTGPIPGGLKSQ